MIYTWATFVFARMLQNQSQHKNTVRFLSQSTIWNVLHQKRISVFTCNAYYNGSTAYKKEVQKALESHKLREKEAMDSKGTDRKIIVFMPLRLNYKPFFTHHMQDTARFIKNASWLFITSQSRGSSKDGHCLYGMKQKGKEELQKCHPPC